MTQVVGIMGGICSGKSTLAQMLANEHDFILIDADQIAHEILQQPQIINKLTSVFGEDIRNGAGNIDNSALARVAFKSNQSTRILNSIMHPPILKEIDERIKNAPQPVLLDAALLVEKGLHERYCDLLVFVDSSAEARRKRAEAHRDWRRTEVTRREQLQVPLERKRQIADIIISNNGTREELRQKIPDIQKTIMNKINSS